MSHKPLQTLWKPIVSEHFYHVTEFNITFGDPRTDTSDTCDSLKLKIDQASEEEKQLLKDDLKAHRTKAKAGYDMFHHDQELAKKSWDTQQDFAIYEWPGK